MNIRTFADRVKAIQDSYYNNMNQLLNDHLQQLDNLHTNVKMELAEVFSDFTGISDESSPVIKEYRG